MKHVFAVAAAFAASILLGACQTDGPKDSGGRTMSLSEWKKVAFHEADLNIPLLVKDIVLTRLERQDRDNRLIHNRYWFDGKKGYAKTQRNPFGSFSRSSEWHYFSKEEL